MRAGAVVNLANRGPPDGLVLFGILGVPAFLSGQALQRRSDGRLKSVEPLTAFVDELERLGHESFRLWWSQTVGELLRCDAQNCPVAAHFIRAWRVLMFSYRPAAYWLAR
jgi:hypothetical protein